MNECADEYRQGALAVLRRCVEERQKIKVWTRNYRYVRGICVGYLVAFDKHWNLVCGRFIVFWSSNFVNFISSWILWTF